MMSDLPSILTWTSEGVHGSLATLGTFSPSMLVMVNLFPSTLSVIGKWLKTAFSLYSKPSSSPFTMFLR